MTRLADFVIETSTNPGTGDFILNGALSGRVAFSTAFADNATVFYFADDGSQAEWGIGTLSSGPPATLARTTILGNTYGNTGILRLTGTVSVYNEVPAKYLPVLDDDGGLTLGRFTADTAVVKDSLTVPDVTDWGANQAVGAKQADQRYQPAGNYQPASYYVGTSSDTSGQTNLRAAGLFYSVPAGAPYMASYNADGGQINYILATQDWTTSWGKQFVTGTGNGNTSITNIQLVNSTGANDGDAAYAQISTLQGAVGVPTIGNVSHSIVSYAQPKGSYVTADVYAQDFNSADSRIILLPFGKMIQFWTGSYKTGDRVTFPRSFSDKVTAISVIARTNNGRAIVCGYDAEDASGFTMTSQREDQNGASNANYAWDYMITAIGPR